jgi:myosin heavy subunit
LFAPQLHSKHPHYVMPTRKNCTDPEARNCFGVLHYAGEVFYNVRGFLDKNRDALHPDVIEAMQSSKSNIVSDIFQVMSCVMLHGATKSHWYSTLSSGSWRFGLP